MPIDFHGSTIVAFESRRAKEIGALIERYGGKSVSAPTMCGVPLETNTQVFDFADRLFDRRIDVVVFLTGVGTRMLAETIAKKHPPERFSQSLQATVTVARGPKSVAALRQLGIKPSVVVPEPNTWQDLLAALDDHHPVKDQQVAVQEYGQPNPQLIDGLKQRGADVLPVPVYRWQLPDDLAPIRSAIDALINGEGDYALFTSATQVDHLFKVAEQDKHADALREAFTRVCIGAIGPIAARAVANHGMAVDFEPDSPHMSHLVRELARRGGDLLDKKRTAANNAVNTNQWKRIDMVWPQPVESTDREGVFLKACRRQPTLYTPIWLMRQAGRYQREYRTVKQTVSFLELCKTPEIAAEITLMAAERLGVDAAIIFADILLPVQPMGMNLRFVKGQGPVIDDPLRSRSDVDRLAQPDVDDLSFVFNALRITRKALRPDIALIGFAGAPFTLASYMIEGGKSNHYLNTKTLMHRDPTAWQNLMNRLTDLLIQYLNAQIAAGADAVQLFDSWVGSLCPDDYRRFVLPHVTRLIAGIDKSAPLIHFATGNPALLPLFKQSGPDVIGLDWRVDLAQAWQMLGYDTAVMGNLDPVILHASTNQIRAAAKNILQKAAGRPGHIFNLGHGILPTTPPQHVAELVDAVHEMSAQ